MNRGQLIQQLKNDIENGTYNEEYFDLCTRCNECVFNVMNKVCAQNKVLIGKDIVGCYGGYKWKE